MFDTGYAQKKRSKDNSTVWLYFVTLGCSEQISSSPQNKTKTHTVTKALPPIEAIPFQKVPSAEPLEVLVDASRVSAELSVMFNEEEALSILGLGLDTWLSGTVQVQIQAPYKVGDDRPYIKLLLTKDQFLSLVPFSNNSLSYQNLVQLFDALNRYKLYVANNGDLRVFHFDLGIQLGQCILLPEHQDSHVAITSVASCGKILDRETAKDFCGTVKDGQITFSDRSFYSCLKELP